MVTDLTESDGCEAEVLGADSGVSTTSMIEVEYGCLSGVGGGARNFSGVSHLLPSSDLGLSEFVGGYAIPPCGVVAFGEYASVDFLNGIDTVTVVPCPGSVFITILPSLSLTNLAATARPKPIDDLSASRHGDTSSS